MRNKLSSLFIYLFYHDDIHGCVEAVQARTSRRPRLRHAHSDDDAATSATTTGRRRRSSRTAIHSTHDDSVVVAHNNDTTRTAVLWLNGRS